MQREGVSTPIWREMLQKNSKLRYYCCGATVYRTPHIGNYLSICRALDYVKKERILLNITDIDDKIIALKNNQPLHRYVNPLIRAHVRQLKQLGYNINDQVVIKRWSLNAKKIFSLLALLDEKGALEKRADGLVHKTEGFYVWKLRALGSAPEVLDSSKFGPGIAGWHSECATLIHTYCDKQLVHFGGADLAMHHKNEDAQLALLGYKIKWVRFALLNSLIKGKQQKMSKSLDNQQWFTENAAFNRYLLRSLYKLTSISKSTVAHLKNQWASIVVAKCRDLYNLSKKAYLSFKRSATKEGLIPLSFLKRNKKVLKLKSRMDAANRAKQYTLSDKIRSLIVKRSYKVINFSDRPSLVYKCLPMRLEKAA